MLTEILSEIETIEYKLQTNTSFTINHITSQVDDDKTGVFQHTQAHSLNFKMDNNINYEYIVCGHRIKNYYLGSSASVLNALYIA